MNRRAAIRIGAAGAVGVVLSRTTENAFGAEAPRAMPRSTPEEQGISSAAVLGFLDAVDAQVHDLHSILLVRHGHVVAEGWWAPYAADRPHMLFSISKSVTSTAVGLAIADGRFGLDDPVLGFFPDKRPAVVRQNLAAMRVRDLLTMTTGHAKDTLPALGTRADGDWLAAFLAQPVEHAPGTHFVYNSGASYVLSAIVQKTTGQRVLDYLRPRLFDPLGFERPAWETSPQGVNTGGWGLKGRTEEIAKFGQLYLQKGVWGGRRLVPETWVAQATARQVPNGTDPDSDWSEGYGYQFWRCRHGAYRCDGALGQLIVVMPEQDAVLAVTAATTQKPAFLNLVWERLLPAFGAALLPADSKAAKALRARLAGLRLPARRGAPDSPIIPRVMGRAYRFAANDDGWESIRYDFTPGGGGQVQIGRKGMEHLLPIGGRGGWREEGGILGTWDGTPDSVAVSGAWTDDHTYALRLVHLESPFCPTITSRFAPDAETVTVDYTRNIGFGPLDGPHLAGRLVGSVEGLREVL